MGALGVHHVALAVTDVVESVDFYTRVLGLTVRADRPGMDISGAWLDAGGQQVHLFVGQPAVTGQHFAIVVDDLDATIATARSAGLEVGTPAPSTTGRQTFLADPSGNLIELRD
jgi:catechol 2,3-dioxygenase-like lactoylglutathione lyase family enzyme